MSRAIVFVSVVVLGFGQVAAAGQVVIYYAEGLFPAGFIIIPEVPADGFILTDIAWGQSYQGSVWVIENDTTAKFAAYLMPSTGLVLQR